MSRNRRANASGSALITVVGREGFPECQPCYVLSWTRLAGMSPPAPRDSAAFEIREALTSPGCPVCRLAVRSVGRLIQSVAYEQVNDPRLRQELRLSHGFCNPHAYRWLREARSVLGTALIYRDVVKAALADLEGMTAANGQRRGLLSSLRGLTEQRADEHRCPACRAQAEAEARYVEALLASVLADERVGDMLDESDGLCRRHTLAAIRLGRPGAERIVERMRSAMQTLLQDLDEVVRKEDYRFRDEPRTDGERTAPSRAIAWAIGIDGLVDE
jgi:Family of unknown function (DUF6062)